MPDEQRSQAVPGWYSDPEQPGQQRYWDGGRWTEERRSADASGQPPPPGQQQQPIYVERVGNGFAVVALVCGIIGAVLGLIPILFFLAWALGLVALVFGILGWRRTRRDPAVGRKGMSIAGTILGIIALALGGLGLAIVNDAFEETDEALEELDRELDELGQP